MYGLTNQEKIFAEQAAKDCYARVMLGKLAVDKSENPSVKELAQKLIAEHTAQCDELRRIVVNKGGTICQNIDAKRGAVHTRLSGLSGAKFEDAYLKETVDDHKRAIGALQSVSKQTNDPELRSWISKSVPVLQQHLKLANTLAQTKQK